jgi:hypothetical protein
VEVSSYPVTYSYSISGLLIPYGSAFLCALGCSIVGLYAFFANNASYQNLFSTYLRATKDSEFDSRVYAGDSGADPLPQPLARSRIAMNKVMSE